MHQGWILKRIISHRLYSLLRIHVQQFAEHTIRSLDYETQTDLFNFLVAK